MYRVVPDRLSAARGYVRVVDESGEDYVYPAGCFAAVEVPKDTERALA